MRMENVMTRSAHCHQLKEQLVANVIVAQMVNVDRATLPAAFTTVAGALQDCLTPPGPLRRIEMFFVVSPPFNTLFFLALLSLLTPHLTFSLPSRFPQLLIEG